MMFRRAAILPMLGLLAACSGAPTPAATFGGGPISTTLEVMAKDIAYDKTELSVVAGQAFAIRFKNQDASSLTHDIEIRKADGQTIIQEKPDIAGGKEIVYEYTALQPGTYKFECSIHPIPSMTGTLTVK